MKSDSSRFTFDPRKHFSGVRMQQGRVQIDADSNEQIDIVDHRVTAEASDVIGACGAPMHYPGFHIVKAVDELSTEEQALSGNIPAPKGSAMIPGKFANPDFLISAGRYYVDGILCENEQLISYLSQSTQADLPNPAPIAKGLYLVYLDVWQRLLTALDDPSIREIALGGPDTATRTKTVWQVKVWPVVDDSGKPLEAGNCVTKFAGYERLIAPSDGKLAARTKREEASTDACLVSPTAGFMGLENQLYRIEIHEGGAALDVAGANREKVPNKAPEGKTSFKWSRDNGVVVTTIKVITGQEVTVHDLGPDDTLGFKEGQWVELSDDSLELSGLPGQLAKITKIDSAGKVITLNITPSLIVSQDPKLPDRHPKLRRWDGVGPVQYDSKTPDNSFLNLENGVQVRFFEGQFKTGDYWTVPARTATADTQSGNIEWPQDAGKEPLAQLPFGIGHHYCRLAMLRWTGKAFDLVQDCRNLFPPITELTSLFYVSGDGQEAMPILAQRANPLTLPQQLIVGVANGEVPVPNAEVRFKVDAAKGNGRILPAGAVGSFNQPDAKTLDVLTDKDGLARCFWQVDSTTQSQQLKASLQTFTDLADGSDRPTHLPVIFTANLSVADQVFYDPGSCGTLANQGTVQRALSRLSQLASLYKISGDSQEIMPREQPAALKVLVASPCGPSEKAEVTFDVVTGGGKVDKVSRGETGIWICNWTPDDTTPFQEVEASLRGDAITPPVTVRFSLNLSKADHVKYAPGECNALKGSDTVQKAIDQLSVLTSLYEVSGNNQMVTPGQKVELKVLAANNCGPVREQRIGLKVSGGGSLNPADPVTNVDGIATTTWIIGPREQPIQQVEARIAESKIPTALPNSVLFNAYFSQAANVFYDPDPKACPELAKARVITVQAALDALCQRKIEEKPEEGIHILDVRAGAASLANDTLVPVSRLAEGITIVCDRPIAPSVAYGNPGSKSVFPSVAPKPTCFVTLDNPGSGFLFQPMILASSVEVKDKEIRWALTAAARNWVGVELFGPNMALYKITDRVLVHLTLKGKFIVSSTEPEIWLDGEAFASAQGDRLDLRFPKIPSGDGRRGGDFEMWFYLFPGLIFDDLKVDANSIGGFVRDASGKGVPGVDVTAIATPQTTTPVVTAKTDGAGHFQLPKTLKGVYKVTAKLGTDLSADREVNVP